jgi:vacuolar-type H+-ATPase subunit F/Vma7
MSAIVALGEGRRIEGFALAGVRLVAAEDPHAMRAAWQSLGQDAGLLLLTPAARAALADLLPTRPDVLWTPIPD